MPVAVLPQTLLRSGFALGVVGTVMLGCAPASHPDPREVVVPATDYAYQLPSDLGSGPTLLRLDNRGKVAHEMALAQLKAGVTADSVIASMAAGGDPASLTDGIVGILIASPGTTSLGQLKVDLAPGRTYMMICQFKDADSLPPHVAMGMQASFVAR